ncbi:MAG: hypothetical protein ABIO92_07035 [Chloroflexia bacterium]
MLNDTQTSTSRNDVNEVVQFMFEISRSVASNSRTAATRSEPHNLTADFEEIISGLSLTQEQLIELWAVFMLGAQVARKVHRDLVINPN